MHWTANFDAIAFTIFGIDVAWYGIMITSAMLIGAVAAIKRVKRVGMTSDDVLELFMICIPMAILFARLGYVLVRPTEYYIIENFNFQDFINIFAIWDGGLTIMSGVPGGVLGGYIWSKWRKVDFISAADLIAPVILLSQGLGRWGNFFNQEIFGAKITNPKWQFFPIAVYISKFGFNGFYQACFAYEMVLDIGFFILLIFITNRLKVKGSGLLLYAGAYSLIRFIMEFFRDDGEIYEVFNFNMIICLAIFVASMALLTVLIVKAVKKGEKIWYKNKIPDNLYKKRTMAVKQK